MRPICPSVRSTYSSTADCTQKNWVNRHSPDFNAILGKRLDLILLTHCHLDHLGALPVIASSHPEAPYHHDLTQSVLSPSNAPKLNQCYEATTRRLWNDGIPTLCAP